MLPPCFTSQTGTGHPTITDVQQGLSVLSRFASDFQHPRDHEGHDRILYLKPSDHTTPEYTRAEISAILERVRDSAPVPRPQQIGPGGPPMPSAALGFSVNEGGRGRGRGYPYSQQRGGGWRGGRPPNQYSHQSPMGGGQPPPYGGAWQRGRGLPPRGWRDRRDPPRSGSDMQ